MLRASVIINTLNDREDWLRQAVDSYLAQQNVEIQLIISTVEDDSSLSVLGNYSNLEFCVSDKNAHQNSRSPRYYQLNNALNQVEHPWWCFAAGDDVALPHKLEQEITLCLQTSSQVCSSAIWKTDAHLNRSSMVAMPTDYLGVAKHLQGNFVADCSLISWDLWKAFGPFDLSLEQMAHWDFWLRVFSECGGDTIVFNSEPTWLYRIHDDCVHQRDLHSENRARKREASRKRMLQKHDDLLKRYDLEFLAYIDRY